MAMLNQQNQNVLDDDRIGRLLFKLSLPTFLGMFVGMLYNVVDTIFIGHYVGSLGIAGLSIVFPLQMMTIGIGELTGMGGASLISRSIGAGDIAKAEKTLGNALTANIIVSLVLMVACIAAPDFWLRLMGSSETILPYARDYLTIIVIGVLFMTFSISLNSLIRAEGNARIPMIGMIIGAVSNIALDAIFIIPLGMGIQGAALATVIAQLISVAFFARYYLSGKSFLKIHLKNLTIQWRILKQILAIGAASFARMLAGSLSAVIVNRMIVFHGGDLAISAFGILHRILMFAILPGLTIGGGLQPILGFNYGAKRYDRAIRAIILAMAAATACCLVVFGVVYFSPETFIRIFTNDAELVVLASHAAKRLFLALPLIGFIMVGSLVFQSIGKAVQSFLTSISRPILSLIPLVLILPHFMGLSGVWWSFPLADVFTLLLTLALLIPQIRELRKKHRLTREIPMEAQPVRRF
jgi:putative MATE family efflux protein